MESSNRCFCLWLWVAPVLSPHTPQSPSQPTAVTAHWETRAVISSASETKRRRDVHLHWPDKSVMCHPLHHTCLPPPLQSSSHTSTRLIRLCRTDIACPSCASWEQVAADVLRRCPNPELTLFILLYATFRIGAYQILACWKKHLSVFCAL